MHTLNQFMGQFFRILQEKQHMTAWKETQLIKGLTSYSIWFICVLLSWVLSTLWGWRAWLSGLMNGSSLCRFLGPLWNAKNWLLGKMTPPFSSVNSRTKRTGYGLPLLGPSLAQPCPSPFFQTRAGENARNSKSPDCKLQAYLGLVTHGNRDRGWVWGTLRVYFPQHHKSSCPSTAGPCILGSVHGPFQTSTTHNHPRVGEILVRVLWM
jgi:hypothetical protein